MALTRSNIWLTKCIPHENYNDFFHSPVYQNINSVIKGNFHGLNKIMNGSKQNHLWKYADQVWPPPLPLQPPSLSMHTIMVDAHLTETEGSTFLSPMIYVVIKKIYPMFLFCLLYILPAVVTSVCEMCLLVYINCSHGTVPCSKMRVLQRKNDCSPFWYITPLQWRIS